METRYLRTFRDLAQTLNITRTSERLEYAPSSIAAHVRALEAEIGVPLIEHAGRNIRLTDAGRLLDERAARILESERDAIASVRAGAEGSRCVTLGSAASVVGSLLPLALAQFAHVAPGTSVSVRQGDCRDHLVAVAAGELDIAVTIEDVRQLDRHRTPAMVSAVLADVPIVTVAGRVHRFAQRPPAGFGDLAGETIVNTELPCSYRESFAAELERHGVVPGTQLDFDNFEAIRQCVEGGVGVAHVPRFVVQAELDAGTIVELPLHTDARFAVVVSWRRAHAPPVATLLDVLREAIPAQTLAVRAA